MYKQVKELIFPAMVMWQSIQLNILSATRDLVHFYVLGDVIDIKL